MLRRQGARQVRGRSDADLSKETRCYRKSGVRQAWGSSGADLSKETRHTTEKDRGAGQVAGEWAKERGARQKWSGSVTVVGSRAARRWSPPAASWSGCPAPRWHRTGSVCTRHCSTQLSPFTTPPPPPIPMGLTQDSACTQHCSTQLSPLTTPAPHQQPWA